MGETLWDGKGGMRTAFGVEPRGVDVQWDEAETLREHLVDNDARVVPHVHVLNRDTRHLQRLGSAPGERGMYRNVRTSAMRILRKAFAIDASTPTRSNSTDRPESRVTFTCRF